MKAFIASFLIICALAPPACAQPNWQTVDADNGAAYKVDLNSISHYANGGAHIIVYAIEGADYNPNNLRRLYFDCRGHYRDETGPIGPITYAAPRSIAGKMSDIACAGAKDTRLEDASRDQGPDTPDQYCKGFSPDACVRIQAAVKSKPKPAYCKQGFALVGSGLTEEQLRTCHVINNEEVRQRLSKLKTQ